MEKSAPLLREVRGKRAEKGIWISFFLLLASGLVALYAASYYNAQDKGSSLSEVISQLMGVGVGAFLMAAVWKLNYRALSNPVISGAFVVVSLLLLGLVAIPGVGVYLNGSGWGRFRFSRRSWRSTRWCCSWRGRLRRPRGTFEISGMGWCRCSSCRA